MTAKHRLNNRGKNTIILFIFILVFLLPFTTFADKCSKKDRRPFPSCFTIGGGSGGNYIITNSCSYEVVMKVDRRPGQDKKIYFPPKAGYREHIGGFIHAFKCCPRYMSGPCG